MTREGALGMAVEDVAEEAVNRRQARVARPHRIAARRFEVREKPQDQIRGQIVDLQRRDRPVAGVRGESEQQFERVPIRLGGVRTGVSSTARCRTKKAVTSLARSGAVMLPSLTDQISEPAFVPAGDLAHHVGRELQVPLRAGQADVPQVRRQCRQAGAQIRLLLVPHQQSEHRESVTEIVEAE